MLTFPPPTHHHVHLRSFASEGTSDSGSGGGGELPGQAGVGHCQTAERGGRCSAGAGQQRHQAASTAAASGKDGHWVAPLMTGAKPDFRKYVPLYLKLVLTTHMICSYLSLRILNRFNIDNYQAVTVLRADWGWEEKKSLIHPRITFGPIVALCLGMRDVPRVCRAHHLPPTHTHVQMSSHPAHLLSWHNYVSLLIHASACFT